MRYWKRAGLASVVAATAFVVGSAAVGAGTRSGTEHFVATSMSATNNTKPVQAFGPISGTGSDKQLDNNHDRFTFKSGAIFVTHHQSSSLQKFDRKNCVGQEVDQGRFEITGGTGAYKNVHGNGVYSVQALFQGCDAHKPPQEASVVIEASGPLTVG